MRGRTWEGKSVVTKATLLRLAIAGSVLSPAAALAEDATPAPSGSPDASAIVSTEAAEDPEEKTDADAEPAFPVSGSVGFSYKFNHANFTPTESDQADFGTQQGSFNAKAHYPFLEKFALDLSLSASKEFAKSYYGANSSQTTIKSTDFSDSSLGLSGEIYTIPVLDISIGASLGASIPTSKASQAAKIYTTVGPGISLGWEWKRLSLGAGFDASYTFAKYRTIHIEGDSAAPNVVQSRSDTGDPLGLWDLSESFDIGVKILDNLSFSTGYSMSHSLLATSGKSDQYTSEYAETGDQWSMPSHGVSFGLRWGAFEKTSVSLGMSTRQALYDKRNSSKTVPIFDWETDTHERTKYSLGVSQAF